MKRTLLCVFLIVGLVGSAAGAESYNVRMDRASGADRVATAVAVSASHWPTAATAILGTSENFPDALAAAALAAKEDAPLLLTPTSHLAQAVRTELQRLGPQKVFILGGHAALSGAVESEVQSLGAQTQRFAGGTRFETAKLIAEAVGRPATSEAVVASGASWPDAVSAGALSASPTRMPILLTERDGLRSETHEALQTLGITRVFISGGPSAVSEGVEAQLRGLGFEVVRLFGSNRYSTSAAVASEATRRIAERPYPVVLATGGSFPDALAASGLAARVKGTLTLVPPDDLTGAPDTAGFLRARAAEISRGVIVGGFSAVRGVADWQLRAVLDGLATPSASFGPGTMRVGTDIAPGTYRSSLAGQGCYWERLSGFSGSFEEINANGLTDHRTIVTISAGDAGFRSDRCGTWSPDLSPITPSPVSPFSDGMYLVGSDVGPGTWRNVGPTGTCYWERLSGFSGNFEQLEANGLSDSQQVVTISETDAGFQSNRCGTWERA